MTLLPARRAPVRTIAWEDRAGSFAVSSRRISRPAALTGRWSLRISSSVFRNSTILLYRKIQTDGNRRTEGGRRRR